MVYNLLANMDFISLLGNPLLYPILIIGILWSAVWKGIALWKCGRNNQLAWFIVLLIVNTFGILEIIYLLSFQKKQERRLRRTREK